MPLRSAIVIAALAAVPYPALSAASSGDPLPYAVDLPDDGYVSAYTARDAHTAPDSASPFAYTGQQRAAWLGECQRNQMPAHRRGRGRLRGKDADRAMAFCEDYLAAYEASAMAPPYRVTYSADAAPSGRTAYRAIYRTPKERTVEEWVEEVPPIGTAAEPTASAPSKPLKRR